MTNVSGFACFTSEKGTELSDNSFASTVVVDTYDHVLDPEVSDSERRKRLDRTLVLWAVVGFAFGLVLGIVYTVAFINDTKPEPSIAVQMYVISVDDGADIERHRIEQAGDQFTYDLPEHVMQNIQQSPTFVSCIDGLAISSVLTEFAEAASCGEPSIHVVLIAPY